jgi:hypothetical protein
MNTYQQKEGPMLPAFWQNLPAKQGETRSAARSLTSSAKRLGTGDRDDNFGSGLIDPLKALQSTDPRTVTTTPPPAPTPLRQR